ncbi:acyl-CoA dehydrogenase/oxidase [Globomyces pollinis-pini]|nr:acyl-CoA dehydrogenase/oxidase [Globomyces pollinis-pini]
MSKEFTRQEVATHNKDTNAWIIIDTIVYDISKFAGLHPGGELLILEYAGQDVTEQFYAFHRQEVLEKYGRLKIGSIVNETPQIIKLKNDEFSPIPYAEASAFQGFHSPYFKYNNLIDIRETHHRFRKAVRAFIRNEVLPEATLNDESGTFASKEIFKKMGDFGLLACRMGPGPHLKGFNLPGGVKPEEFDYFHEQIAHEETTTLGFAGYQDSIGTGMVIGLPPVMNFAKKNIRERVTREVLTGVKRICLAISEPGAGSDVAAIKTTAVKTADGLNFDLFIVIGKHYIVNGVKKWITNGSFSDYFSTAVVTGKGPAGISMLLIERSEGVETKPIKTSYSSSAGTAYVIFENVKVPVENLLGKEGGGFPVIMYNFNHERWFIVAGIVSATRKVIEECFKWANQRKVFGKSLLEQPVIRNKLAHMISKTEATNNWLENITYQMQNMNYKEQQVKLGGPIALLKLLSTRVAHDVADEACQIFGGRGITKTGMGRMIEGFQRTYKFAAILGGSEEIMADLGIRQAMRNFPNARL